MSFGNSVLIGHYICFVN